MDSAFRKRLIATLEAFSDGREHDVNASTGHDLKMVKECFESGYLKGMDNETDDGIEFMELRISESGSDLLEDDRKERIAGKNREKNYELEHPIRAKIVIGAAVAVLAFAAIAFLKWAAAHGGSAF